MKRLGGNNASKYNKKDLSMSKSPEGRISVKSK